MAKSMFPNGIVKIVKYLKKEGMLDEEKWNKCLVSKIVWPLSFGFIILALLVSVLFLAVDKGFVWFQYFSMVVIPLFFYFGILKGIYEIRTQLRCINFGSSTKGTITYSRKISSGEIGNTHISIKYSFTDTHDKQIYGKSKFPLAMCVENELIVDKTIKIYFIEDEPAENVAYIQGYSDNYIIKRN